MSLANGNSLLLTGGEFQISRSIRLRKAASAYFSRTPAGAGNRRTWTISAWHKRGALSADQNIFGANAGGTEDAITFLTNNDIRFRLGGVVTQLNTNSLYRDSSAWYHIVLALDTTQATASNRVKLYINSVQVTSFAIATYPVQNYQSFINGIYPHNIGALSGGLTLDGYLAEVNFIDDQALEPSSFGEMDAIIGVWKPKRYAGIYGTNGFYVKFSDPSALTAAAIGKDYSGNGNNWTPTNLNLTLGNSYDSMLDVPTLWADGADVRGNYCVMNPLVGTPTLTAANLNVSGTDKGATGTIAFPSSGKWYFEMLCAASAPSTNDDGVGITTGSVVYIYRSSGNKLTGVTTTAYGATYATNDTIGIAFDADAGTLTFYKNNISQGTAFTGLSSATQFFPYVYSRAITSAPTLSINFGQRPFLYTPPSGFKTLNTGNLPEPSITNGRDWFDVKLTSGADIKTDAEATFTGNELVWIKDRFNVNNHQLIDTVRGTSAVLQSNTTAADTTYTAPVGNSVGWVWKEGATPGFNIVTYTGTGANRTVDHSLGVAPAMMIVKQRTAASSTNWAVQHQSLPNANWYLQLNTNSVRLGDATVFNTTPTSANFSVGTNSSVNANTGTYVAYLFSQVEGFSRFGSYIGIGGTDGTFVFCGFRPRYLLVKRTDVAESWIIRDTTRDPNNSQFSNLAAQLSNAQFSGVNLDTLSNGFKLRGSGAEMNANTGTYIFAAFAENPFKYSLAR